MQRDTSDDDEPEQKQQAPSTRMLRPLARTPAVHAFTQARALELALTRALAIDDTDDTHKQRTTQHNPTEPENARDRAIRHSQRVYQRSVQQQQQQRAAQVVRVTTPRLRKERELKPQVQPVSVSAPPPPVRPHTTATSRTHQHAPLSARPGTSQPSPRHVIGSPRATVAAVAASPPSLSHHILTTLQPIELTPAMRTHQDAQLATFIHTCYHAIVYDKCGERRVPEQRGMERFEHYVRTHACS